MMKQKKRFPVNFNRHFPIVFHLKKDALHKPYAINSRRLRKARRMIKLQVRTKPTIWYVTFMQGYYPGAEQCSLALVFSENFY